MPPLIAIITTHTTRHLRRTLLGIACQTRRPGRVIVSCDGDGADVRDEVAAASAEFGLGVTLVQRAHAGVSRSGQVRNNAMRLLAGDNVSGEALLVFLDGDICAAPGCFAEHERLAQHAVVVLGFRHDLTREQTEAFDEAGLRAGREPAPVTPEQVRALEQRHRRYAWQVLLRRVGLGKGHKPKLLSANFAVRLGAMLRVNGFDELYEGYGQEDDDLGRRLYAAGYRPALGIRSAIAYHLWHETRAPGAWEDSPNAARFARGGPVRCVQGVANPSPQATIRRTELGGTGERGGSPVAEPAAG